jgi:hypothetical protein
MSLKMDLLCLRVQLQNPLLFPDDLRWESHGFYGREFAGQENAERKKIGCGAQVGDWNADAEATNIDHLEEAEEHGQSGEPPGLLLDHERELLDASVVEGVSRDRVPALGRQRLPQVDVVGGAVGAAAANLKFETFVSGFSIYNFPLNETDFPLVRRNRLARNIIAGSLNFTRRALNKLWGAEQTAPRDDLEFIKACVGSMVCLPLLSNFQTSSVKMLMASQSGCCFALLLLDLAIIWCLRLAC